MTANLTGYENTDKWGEIYQQQNILLACDNNQVTGSKNTDKKWRKKCKWQAYYIPLTDLSWSSHVYLNADLVPFAPPPSIDQNSKILLTAPLLYDVYPPLKFSVPHA